MVQSRGRSDRHITKNTHIVDVNSTHILCYSDAMESKTARLTVLVDPTKKKAFEELCARQDLTPSQVIRQLMRDYLAKHGVDYATKAKSR